MKKIILLKGQTETLEFFSKRLNIYLKKYGYETFIYDISLGDEQIDALEEYTEIGNTVFITYNFNGISGEKIFLDAKGRLFFDEFYIECINIVVDHPMYYYKYYNSLPRMYRQINIDRHRRHGQNEQDYERYPHKRDFVGSGQKNPCAQRLPYGRYDEMRRHKGKNRT